MKPLGRGRIGRTFFKMLFSLKTMLCIGCGCFLGGILRYTTSFLICSKWQITSPQLPWNTLIINFIGCLFMGLFCASIHEGQIASSQMRAALTTGLCGGYSTLAAFAYENTFILKSGSYLTATLYTSATIVGSIVCFILGYASMKALFHS